MKKIIIKEVPKSQIRNKGVGDYRMENGILKILVAKGGDRKFRQGVVIHELAEAMLARNNGIPFKKIEDWDRKNIKKKGEPGEMKGAPYKKEHAVANKIEDILVKELNKNS